MAEIVLNVEVRERTGTGGARETRRAGKVPGVLYGGDRGPVPIAVGVPAFKKALYTGKLLGHLVTLKYGKETQPVIAKDVQFHPVTDEPMHFDLYRVDEHQQIRISVPVHFRGQDVSQLDDDQLSAIRNTEIGFIFQSFNLIAQYTVLENIEVPLHYRPGAPPLSAADRA